jgi:hypothetical protein
VEVKKLAAGCMAKIPIVKMPPDLPCEFKTVTASHAFFSSACAGSRHVYVKLSEYT